MGEHRVAISAHRGGAEDAPLASWESYLASIETAAEYVELDIRRTEDDVLVAHHDRYLTAIKGRPLINRLTYPRLCELAGYRVPQVPELLELIAGHARGHLDLKEIGYERRILDLARVTMGAGNFLVSTLEEETVRAVKQLTPDVPVALTLGRDNAGTPLLQQPRVRLGELLPLRRVRRCGADWVSMHYVLAQAGVLRMCAREGLPAIVFTVNDQPRIERYLTDPRVSMLVTDRPKYAASRRTALATGARLDR
jgi:glycerophosphoryl diester phosphodiesterase